MSSSREADEKIVVAPAVAIDDVQTEKEIAKITDEAGEMAVVALASGEVDPVMSKKVLRKIDMYLLPMLCVTYGICILPSKLNC